MFLLGCAYTGIIVLDLTYTKHCGAYSTNMIFETLVSSSRLPPSPLDEGFRNALRFLRSFPTDKVNQISGNINPWYWYLGIMVPFVMLLFVLAVEAEFLSHLVERGPLGLGVNYIIGWDEVLNRDALRSVLERKRRSQFIEDATLPLPYHVEVDASTGYAATGTEVSSLNYGSFQNEQNKSGAFDIPHLPKVQEW